MSPRTGIVVMPSRRMRSGSDPAPARPTERSASGGDPGGATMASTSPPSPHRCGPDDGHRRPRGDGGVGGRAAPVEHAEARRRGQLVGGRHHAAQAGARSEGGEGEGHGLRNSTIPLAAEYGGSRIHVCEEVPMATEKKEESAGLSTAEKDKLDDKEFAFPRERKEPLVDASRTSATPWHASTRSRA